MAIAGDAAATDPACVKSPIHARMAALTKAGITARGQDAGTTDGFVYRRIGGTPQASSSTPVKPDPALTV